MGGSLTFNVGTNRFTTFSISVSPCPVACWSTEPRGCTSGLVEIPAQDQLNLDNSLSSRFRHHDQQRDNWMTTHTHTHKKCCVSTMAISEQWCVKHAVDSTWWVLIHFLRIRSPWNESWGAVIRVHVVPKKGNLITKLRPSLLCSCEY